MDQAIVIEEKLFGGLLRDRRSEERYAGIP